MKIFAFAILLFCSFDLIAQLEHINLNNYVTPDLTLNRLNISGGLFGRNSGSSSSSNTFNFSNDHLSLSYDVGYRNYGFSRAKVSNKYLNTYGQFSTTESHGSTYDYLRTHSQILQLGSSDKFYKKDNKFLEIAPSGGLSFWSQRHIDNNILESDVTRFSANVKLGLYKGTGRLESIHDMRSAIFILEGLVKEGRLNITPDSTQVQALAQLIGVINNERFFDFRHKRKFQMIQLDSFLRAQNLINDPDGLYFATLVDEYRYSNRFTRFSGSEFKFGIIPEYRYGHNSRDESVSVDETNEIKLAATVRYLKEKAVGHDWQWRLSTGVNAAHIIESTNFERTTSTNENRYTHEELNPFINVRLSYYPNSRTYFNIAWNNNLLYRWTKRKDIASADSNGWTIGSNLDLNFYYYISPQLRLSGNFGASLGGNQREFLNNISDSNYHRLRGGFSIGYSFF